MLLLALVQCSKAPGRHEIIEPAPISKDSIQTRKNIPETHKAFLARFLPEIQKANNNILTQRNRLLDLRDSLDDKATLEASELQELNNLLEQYRLQLISMKSVPKEDSISPVLDRLLKRVDIIPVKLVMAQAIIESGWGTSSFAREGNNYFGVHCYTEGCGIRPSGRDSASFYVKVYPSEMAGIHDYLWILNTGHAYRELRQMRKNLREEGKAIDALVLAEGLQKYSIKGEKYVQLVSNIIRNYIPANTSELLRGKNSGD